MVLNACLFNFFCRRAVKILPQRAQRTQRKISWRIKMVMKDYLLLFSPLIAAGISSYLTYLFAIKSKHQESILKFKEEKYSNLLILLQGFVGKTANGNTQKQFFEEQYRSWLYSSDDVVKAINQMVKLVIDSRGNQPDRKAGRKAVGDIVLAMRKDLLKKTNLTYNNFVYTDVI